MELLTLILAVIFSFCLLFYVIVAYLKPYARQKQIHSGGARRRVLFVTAHPDDETMFFGPTIIALCRQQRQQQQLQQEQQQQRRQRRAQAPLPTTSRGDPKEAAAGDDETEAIDTDNSCIISSNNGIGSVNLLCLSNGDHRKRGNQRKQELFDACALLGIPEENITLLRHTRLRDDPTVRWREELVSEIILHHAEANDVDTIVTFDRQGVSGHKNHGSLFNACAFLCMENRLPKNCRVLNLRSVNLLRKYSCLFDVPMSFLLCPTAYIASFTDWFRLQRAMAAHRSQYVWFRKLYMVFSRYCLINTYDQLNVPVLEPSSASAATNAAAAIKRD